MTFLFLAFLLFVLSPISIAHSTYRPMSFPFGFGNIPQTVASSRINVIEPWFPLCCDNLKRNLPFQGPCEFRDRYLQDLFKITHGMCRGCCDWDLAFAIGVGEGARLIRWTSNDSAQENLSQ